MWNWSTCQMKWFSVRKEVCNCSTRNWMRVFLVPVWYPPPQTILLMPSAPALDLSLGSKTLCANDAWTQAWGSHSATLLNKSLIYKTCSKGTKQEKKTRAGLDTLWFQHEWGQNAALENITQYYFEQRLLMRPHVNWGGQCGCTRKQT